MNTYRAVQATGGCLLLVTLIAIALVAAPDTPAQAPIPSDVNVQSNGLVVSKTLETSLIVPGLPITYTIHLRIDGASVHAVSITDTLPLSTTWLHDTAPALGLTRVQTTPHAMWTTATLGVGSSSFQLRLNVPADLSAALITNTLQMSALSGTMPISHTFSLTTPVAQESLFLPVVMRDYPPMELPPPIPVGAHPKSLAISEAHNRVYVTLYDDDGSGSPGGDGALAVIDLTTHQLLTKTTTGGVHPLGIAVISDTLYVANNGSNTVSVLDAVNLTLQQTITVGLAPFGVAATSDRIYVTNFDDDSLTIINPLSNTVVATATVGHQPAFSAAHGNCAYVPNHGDGAEGVTVVCNDGSEIYRLREEWGYFAAAYFPNPTALWNPLIVLSRRDGAPGLYEISTGPPYGEDKPVRKKDRTDTPPFAIAYNPTTDHLLVVAADNEQLHIVYPGSYEIGTVWPLPPQHEGPERLGGCGVAASGHWAWVTNYADGSVSVLYDP